MCTEVASCTCIRHLLLQFNMGISLLFSESNKKRISFHSSKKYSFISFKSKTDPVAFKCHTHTLLLILIFTKPCRVEALREAYDQVISAVFVTGLEFQKPACGSWGKSVPSGGCKLFSVRVFFFSSCYIFAHMGCEFSPLRLDSLINIHRAVTHGH